MGDTSRRGFLKALASAAAGAAVLELDPERLLWVPGAKRIVDLGATTRTLIEKPTVEQTLLVSDLGDAYARGLIADSVPVAQIRHPYRMRIDEKDRGTVFLDDHAQILKGIRADGRPMTGSELAIFQNEFARAEHRRIADRSRALRRA